MSDGQRQEQREAMVQAAEARAKTFKQGGGGERLKAKSKKREAAEQEARMRGGGENQMRWTST